MQRPAPHSGVQPIRERIGIMGGTFDPIHMGHLVAGEEVRARLGLSRVIFMVAGDPPHKSKRVVSDSEDRYSMTELAIASNPDFSASRLEIDRDGPTYTVDTMLALRRLHPEADLFFITGADAVFEIIGWDRADVLADLVTFVGVSRPGYDISAQREEHDNASSRFQIEFLQIPALAISSTDLRQRIRAGLPIRYLTPDPVVDYIHAHGLYREAGR